MFTREEEVVDTGEGQHLQITYTFDTLEEKNAFEEGFDFFFAWVGGEIEVEYSGDLAIIIRDYDH